MILNISPERSFNTLLEHVEKRKTIFYDIIGQNALSIAQRRYVRLKKLHSSLLKFIYLKALVNIVFS